MIKKSIEPIRVIKMLSLAIGLLFVLNLAVILLKLYFPEVAPTFLYYFIKLFDFDGEKNIPTLFSFGLLICNAVLLYFTGLKARSDRKPYAAWYIISLAFVFIAFDEILSFHEHLSIWLRLYLNTSDVWFFAWVIPYGLGLIIGVLLCLKFLRGLPKNTFRLFILSGFIYVTGAIGMEMLAGPVAESAGTSNLKFYILYTIEETFEMIGQSIFMFALLSHKVFYFEISDR